MPVTHSEESALEAALSNAKTTIEKINAQNALALFLATRDLDRSFELARAAESNSREACFHSGLAHALKIQSENYRRLGDMVHALSTANEAMKLYKTLNEQIPQADLLRFIGKIYADLGDFAKGLNFVMRALSIAEKLNDTFGQAVALNKMGIIHSLSGEPAKAISYYGRSIELYDALNNTHRKAEVFNSCCVDYTKLGDYERAESYGKEALKYFLESGDIYGTGVARSSLGEVSLAKADYPTAIEHFNHALLLLQNERLDVASIEVLDTYLNLAQAHIALNELTAARYYVGLALVHAEKQNTQACKMRSYELLAQICEQEQDFAAALAHLKKYVTIREVIMNETSKRDLHTLHHLYDTQQAQAESERQKKLREQERQNFERLSRIKDEFLHSATHDIKNPLSVINISTSLLSGHLNKSNPALLRYTEQINRGTYKIRRLIEDILDLAKLEAMPSIHLEPVALNQWFDHLVDEVRTLTEAKKITLTTEVTPPDLVGKVNKQRLGQAIENLLSNAIKYAPDGASVLLKATQTEKHLEIRVMDNGRGIPTDAIPRLFERFYRVHTREAQGVEGTGLGLSIVKLCVEQHRGTIDVESEMGKGTTFTLKLPLALEDALHPVQHATTG